jgi:hypothetical protein
MTPNEQEGLTDLGGSREPVCLRWHVLRRCWLDVLDIDHGVATCDDWKGNVFPVANLWLVEKP